MNLSKIINKLCLHNIQITFTSIINKNIIHCINQFVSEVNKLANIKESFKDVGYFSYVKDVVYFKHIGIIYGNIFLLSNKNKLYTT